MILNVIFFSSVLNYSILAYEPVFHGRIECPDFSKYFPKVYIISFEISKYLHIN